MLKEFSDFFSFLFYASIQVIKSCLLCPQKIESLVFSFISVHECIKATPKDVSQIFLLFMISSQSQRAYQGTYFLL